MTYGFPQQTFMTTHLKKRASREVCSLMIEILSNNICKIQFFICITIVGKFYSFPIRVSGYIKARIEFVFTTLLWSNGNRSKIKIWKSSCNNSGRRVFGCGKLPQRNSNSKILIGIMFMFKYCQTWNSILLIHF